MLIAYFTIIEWLEAISGSANTICKRNVPRKIIFLLSIKPNYSSILAADLIIAFCYRRGGELVIYMIHYCLTLSPAFLQFTEVSETVLLFIAVQGIESY